MSDVDPEVLAEMRRVIRARFPGTGDSEVEFGFWRKFAREVYAWEKDQGHESTEQSGH